MKKVSKMERHVQNKEHSLYLWEFEKSRFLELLGKIPEQDLNIVCNTSPLHRTMRELVACMVVWFDAGCKYFSAISKGNSSFKVEDVTGYTDRGLAQYKFMTMKQLWDTLFATEKHYRSLIETIDERTLMCVKRNWHWLIWTAPGHYNEHFLQIDAHYRGKTEKSTDVIWLNPYQEK